MTASCLYEGAVRHRRTSPAREFRHGLLMAYIDLEELPGLLGGRLVAKRPGVVRFRRADYLGPREIPLDHAVRDAVAAQTGRRPNGPVRVLTHLRSFGHCFNPVSFYYCFDPRGETVECMLAEVTNTPWGERRAYVVAGGAGHFAKALHVSPFMGMEQEYVCRAARPGRTLSVHIESREAGQRAFDATLVLRRHELTRASLRRATLRYPAPTLRVLGLIYWQALGLRLAGAPVFVHPEMSSCACDADRAPGQGHGRAAGGKPRPVHAGGYEHLDRGPRTGVGDRSGTGAR
jgi:DUF1365 family protein